LILLLPAVAREGSRGAGRVLKSRSDEEKVLKSRRSGEERVLKSRSDKVLVNIILRIIIIYYFIHA
jgi:hypothetical protein